MNTPEEMVYRYCPLARTFGTAPVVSGCRGPECAVWRWEKISTAHPLWAPAVRTKAAELDEKVPYAKASAWVAANLAELGMVPVKGYCGAGGAP